MNKYLILIIYFILVVFTYIYDLLLGNQINPVAYDKRNNYITIFYFIGNFIWGLIIFYSNYLGYNILSLILFLFYCSFV
jgi:hypothetical protein